ncbi:MAG: family 10 glycosylhydrolase [Candidatus Delongbacteria bacterium]|nr:family 10 glycosylhydrolase [Candidatus Delongbacteria bacterium]
MNLNDGDNKGLFIHFFKTGTIPALVILLIFLSCVTAPPPPSSIKPEITIPEKKVEEIPCEFRGIWVTRFEWMAPGRQEIEQNIRRIMQTIADANFNAVFFQVRGQADTYYPSPIEPWSESIADRAADWDPLKFAIEEAHRHHLQFHAYLNLLPLWSKTDPPADSNHLFFQHGPHVKPESSWICFDKNGPMAINEYYYLNPALPQVRAYLKAVVGHLVMNYEIDGLHFDRIRYPGREYLFDPYTNLHFPHDSLTNPQTRESWGRNRLNLLVQDIAATAFSIKPYLLLSCASWGIYRQTTIPGYDRFSSGYDSYLQDAVEWLNRGWMDFIVPMTYWDIPDPKPNFDELWMDFSRQTHHPSSVFMGIRSRLEWLQNGEIMNQIEYLRKHHSRGHLFFSYSDIRDSLQQAYIRTVLYPNPVRILQDLKKSSPEQIVRLQILDELDTPLTDTRITLPDDHSTQITDQQGWAGFILSRFPDTLRIQTPAGSRSIATGFWHKPYIYSIRPDGRSTRTGQWIECRYPERDTINRPVVNLLFKSSEADQVKINHNNCKRYQTGIFFDRMELQPGRNTITAAAYSGRQVSALYQTHLTAVISEPQIRSSFPLWLDTTRIEPRDSLILSPDDKIHLSLMGSKNQKAIAYLEPGHKKIPLYRINYKDYSLFSADYPLKSLKPDIFYTIRYRIESTETDSSVSIEYLNPNPVMIHEDQQHPFLKTRQPETILTYDIGEIRLGAPIRTELDSGIILQSTGQFGSKYRIRLNDSEFGYIDRSDIEIIPGMTARPVYYINSLSIDQDSLYERVTIPYPESIPYQIYPNPEQKLISLVLYGVKTNSTWLTHHDSLVYIRQVTWEQIAPETYKINLFLNTSKIWGYSIRRENNALVLRLKHPPQLTVRNDTIQPTGLTIALEAGHGGDNLGAIGLSGLLEKDINLELAKTLESICTRYGIKVIQIREKDTAISLTEKRQRVELEDPDIFISLHANAASTDKGYLGANGTSTYYHNPFWYDLARLVYQRLIELPIGHFGIVGSFNYKPIRMTARPAVLVEQAFMSQAEDEEKMADPDFRQGMADKILHGILDYVGLMYGKPVQWPPAESFKTLPSSPAIPTDSIPNSQ